MCGHVNIEMKRIPWIFEEGFFFYFEKIWNRTCALDQLGNLYILLNFLFMTMFLLDYRLSSPMPRRQALPVDWFSSLARSRVHALGTWGLQA